MNNTINTTNPPIYSLPQIASSAVEEMIENLKTPQALPFSSALFVMAHSCQDLINVRRPNGLESPVSIYVASIATSGERKTTTDEILMKPLREYETEALNEYEDQYKIYAIEHQTWEIKRLLLSKQLSQTSLNAEEESKAKAAYKHHAILEPKKPKLFRTIYTDITKEALISSLHNNWLSAAIVSNEGDEVLNGPAMRSFALINNLWGGSDITFDRKSAPPVRLRGVRLSISLQLQPSALVKFLNNRSEEAIGSGALARFMFCQPPSTQGARFINDLPMSWHAVSKFHDRVRQLIKQSHALGNSPDKRITLEFTPEAGAFWIREYNAFEKAVDLNGPLFQSKEHAAKAADNMARLAAIFHYFQGDEGGISLKSIQSASSVIRWFENEYVRIFVPPPQLPQEQQDAYDLENWLRGGSPNGAFNNRWRYVRKNYIRQHSPNHLREKNRLNRALNQLVQYQRLNLLSNGKTAFIDLFPWMPFDQNHWNEAVHVFMATQ